MVAPEVELPSCSSSDARPVRERGVRVEIVVTGRNVEVPEHFRVHVAEKVERLERYDHKIVGLEVELFHERNRRQLKNCQRVEITGRGCGPVARAEASAQDFYSALDAAIAKLEARMRRSHDRRRITARRSTVLVGRGSGGQTLLLDAPGDVDVEVPGPRDALDTERQTPPDLMNGSVDVEAGSPPDDDAEFDEHRPGRIVRRKVHTAHPMSVDDALSRMELVGHDFYLFSDTETGAPSVVYRRKGYDYGVIRLSH
jgi:ribosomal subunit interface protein